MECISVDSTQALAPPLAGKVAALFFLSFSILLDSSQSKGSRQVLPFESETSLPTTSKIILDCLHDLLSEVVLLQPAEGDVLPGPVQQLHGQAGAHLTERLTDEICSGFYLTGLDHDLHVTGQHRLTLGHDQTRDVHGLELEIILQILPGDQVSQRSQVLQPMGCQLPVIHHGLVQPQVGGGGPAGGRQTQEGWLQNLFGGWMRKNLMLFW